MTIPVHVVEHVDPQEKARWPTDNIGTNANKSTVSAYNQLINCMLSRTKILSKLCGGPKMQTHTYSLSLSHLDLSWGQSLGFVFFNLTFSLGRRVARLCQMGKQQCYAERVLWGQLHKHHTPECATAPLWKAPPHSPFWWDSWVGLATH